jgi:hypothetical protein
MASESISLAEGRAAADRRHAGNPPRSTRIFAREMLYFLALAAYKKNTLNVTTDRRRSAQPPSAGKGFAATFEGR